MEIQVKLNEPKLNLVQRSIKECNENFYDIQDSIPHLFNSNNSLRMFVLWDVLIDKKEVKNMEEDYTDFTEEETEQVEPQPINQKQEKPFDIMEVCQIPNLSI